VVLIRVAPHTNGHTSSKENFPSWSSMLNYS
ncbi:MAG: hypothetical protein ACI90V_011688, partial [Bacillariaceae sp.]